MARYEKIQVRNVRQVERKFEATVTVNDTLAGTSKTYEVNTNKRGEGFWIDGKQCAGTCQFSATSKNAFRAAVRRWFM